VVPQKESVKRAIYYGTFPNWLNAQQTPVIRLALVVFSALIVVLVLFSGRRMLARSL
jgi:hypothetical protein